MSLLDNSEHSIKSIQFYGKPSVRDGNKANDFGVKAESYDIQASARGEAAPAQRLSSAEVKDKLVVLEFEGGKKLWARGERLLEKLSTEQVRQSRAGKVTPSDEVSLPVVWQTTSAARGEISRLLLKGLSFFGFDKKEAEVLRAKGVKHIEDKLVMSSTGEALDTKNLAASSGWLFPVNRDWTLKSKEPITNEKKLSVGQPYLLFLHGTGSSSTGSFGKLAGTDEWEALLADYPDRLLAFEHRSLSASPIQNVLDLAELLPVGTRLHLVSHSRGGLLGELLCLSQARFEEDLSLDEWLKAFDELTPDGADDEARAHEKELLRKLWHKLKEKRFVVERFVRVACPAQGTTWLADNVAGRVEDFLAVLLFSMQFVDGASVGLPTQFLEAVLAAPLELRQQLPGLEAMNPNAPLIRCLNHPQLITEAALTVLKGNSNVGLSFWSIGTLLANAALREASDLVVHTKAMSKGIKRPKEVWQFLDEGSDVTHFNYFTNADTRTRLVTALRTLPNEEPAGFPLTARSARSAVALTREKVKPSEAKGTIFVIPGIMGSRLAVQGKDVWLSYKRLWLGGMADLKLAAGAPEHEVIPSGVIADDYQQLIEELERNYFVEPFPYDWRLSVKDAGEKLAKSIRKVMATTSKPVHLLAHSMGGLVARSMIAGAGDLWRELGERQGRLVMLGTPNNGAPAIAAMLLGQEKLVKKLALLDIKHRHNTLLDILRAFPGVVDLLPDEFLASDDAPWAALKAQERAPIESLRRAAREWRQKHLNEKAIDTTRMIYVAGAAARTPQLLRHINGEIEIVDTEQGDGRVPYEKYGRLEGVPVYYANVIHGSMANEPRIFSALLELLEQGKTDQLKQYPPARRGITERELVTREADLAVTFPTEAEDLLESLRGGVTLTQPLTQEPVYTLQLSVIHGHLRHANYPLAVGHYAGDRIVSAEWHLDRELKGALSDRHAVGLYPGAIGSADVVYLGEKHNPPGALVIGLGNEVGEVSADAIKQGIAEAALRYALLQAERPAKPGETGYRSAAFSSLLIGSYAGRALSVAECVEAIVAGAVDANRRLQLQGLWERVRIDKIELVELYEDVAIMAMQAIHRLRRQPPTDFGENLSFEIMPRLLNAQDGGRYQRPVSFGNTQWWRRIQIVNANREQIAVAAPPAFPDLLRLLSAHPSMHEMQSQFIAKLIEEAATVPAQRAYLAQLIQQLLTREQPAPTDEWLKFTLQGDRARAESLQQVNQRYWLNRLIEQSVSDTTFRPELAATLYELLVPSEFKWQTEDLLLILDRGAAQYPWELLLDRAQREKPVVTQIGLLRQFVTAETRPYRMPAIGINALVVGDTVGHRFGKLPGARQEAEQVARALSLAQYHVTPLIQKDDKKDEQPPINGLKIITEMFAREYRIMHIAAHGTFDVGDAKRQGIVLGDSEYLTTAELVKLRAVPDLVFINCCHLGKLDDEDDTQTLAVSHPHRLAASIAEELINIGVKAVVAAGWAVDDEAALTFASEFYREMLNGERFGDAVKKARKRTYQRHKDTNTWGAYQCYGSPDYVLPYRSGSADRSQELRFYSRREFRDELKSIAEQPEVSDPITIKKLMLKVRQIEKELPEEYDHDGEVLSALANAWSKLGEFEKARNAYQKALNDKDARAALRSLEQAINMVSRMIDKQWYKAEKEGLSITAEEQARWRNELTHAYASLDRLNDIGGPTNERQSLKARVEKSWALIRTDDPAESMAALKRASELYQKASDNSARKGKKQRDHYPTYNWLACEYFLQQAASPKAKRGKGAPKGSTPATGDFKKWFNRMLIECESVIEEKLKEKDDFALRVALPDAAILRALEEGKLAARKEILIGAYQEAFHTGPSPTEVDSALTQLDFIRVMLSRLAKPPAEAEMQALREIKETLIKELV